MDGRSARRPVDETDPRAYGWWSRLFARFARCSTIWGSGWRSSYGPWSRLIARFARCSTTWGSGPRTVVRPFGLDYPLASLAARPPVVRVRGPSYGPLVSTIHSLRSLLDHLGFGFATVVRPLGLARCSTASSAAGADSAALVHGDEHLLQVAHGLVVGGGGLGPGSLGVELPAGRVRVEGEVEEAGDLVDFG